MIEQDEDWKKIEQAIQHRHRILLEEAQRLFESGYVGGPPPVSAGRLNALQLSATDLFVDKAQLKLTSRGRLLAVSAAMASLANIGILAGAAFHLYTSPIKDMLGGGSIHDLNNYFVAIVLMKALGASGFVIGACVFLAHISRAMLHEANVLFSRRHALRFGRLWIYLTSGPIRLKEMEEAFQWSTEFTSAFKDMNPENMVPKNVVSTISDGAKGVAKSATKGAKAVLHRARSTRTKGKRTKVSHPASSPTE